MVRRPRAAGHSHHSDARSVTLLRRCLASLRAETDYGAIEIVIVDNGSTDAETLEYLRDLGQGASILLVTDPGDSISAV